MSDTAPSAPVKKGTAFFSSFGPGCLLSLFLFLIPVVVVLLLLWGAFSQVSTELKSSLKQATGVKRFEEKVLQEGISDKKIAQIRIEGVIGENSRQTERWLREIDQAAGDDQVVALVIYVNSPGGGVTESDTIYHRLKLAKEKKPVVVYMDSLAASGGYYISCAANHITANANTLTGSIGVIISGINFAQTMEKIGLKAEIYTSGAFKDMLSPMREPRADEKEYIQSIVEEAYTGFLQVVSEGRNLPIKDLMARHAVDGRVITGKKALALGLVDANGYLGDAVEKAKELAKEPGASVMTYHSSDFEGLLENLFEMKSPASKVQVELMASPLPQLKPGVPYLLPSSYVNGAIPATTK